jgi:thioredoxin 1
MEVAILTKKHRLLAGMQVVIILVGAFLAVGGCSPSEAGDRPSLVYFRVSNCPYCKQMNPVVDEIARQYGRQLDVVYAQVDEQEGKDLARHHGIIGYPAILLLDSTGERAGLLRGVVPRANLEQMIDGLLSTE